MSGKRVIGIIVLLAIVAGAVFGVTAIIRENRITDLRNKAAAMCRNGQYEEAREVFSRFDDDVAKSWVQKCDRGIADRKALALLEEGKNAEAFELLKAENPESSYLDMAVEGLAAELAGQGDAAAAVKLLEDENHPDRNLRETYAEKADEQAFWRFLEEGKLSEALESFRAVKARHTYINSETEEKLAEMSRAYDNAEAASLLEKGEYFSAFKRYEKLENEEGMLSVLDAMEVAGDYLHAFRCLAEKADPDVARLDALYGRLTEAGYLPLGKSEFCHFDSTGRLNYYNLDIGSLLSKLLAKGSDEAAALAAKITDNIAEECRALVDEGKRRSSPYSALGELKKRAGSLWTDELQLLMDRCVEMPENGVILDKDGLQTTPGSMGSASVTVKNNSKTRGVLLRLHRTSGEPSGIITVFVRPDSSFVFTVIGGSYEAKTWQGKLWYGSEEGFGSAGEISDVEIRDNLGLTTTEKLSGIYLLTVN